MRDAATHASATRFIGSSAASGGAHYPVLARSPQMVSGKILTVPSSADALPGRAEKMRVPETHFVNGHRLTPPFPDGLARAMFAMGCFWGAEKQFWQLAGVYSTAVGYA